MAREEALAEKATQGVTKPDQVHQGQTQLTFFQRQFYRPTNHGWTEKNEPEVWRFSFLSRGALLVGALTCLIIIAILASVLGTMLDNNKKTKDAAKHPSPINQAILANFPDPAVVHHDGTWYAFATNDAAGILAMPENLTVAEYGTSNVQIATSQNFNNWTLLNSTNDPLPDTGAWVEQGFGTGGHHIPRANVWAPAVLKRPSDGKFILYYSALSSNGSRAHCVGAAVSNTSSPAGPYEPLQKPLACPTQLGGAIDPATFIDTDGTIYVAWKVDGNNRGHGGICGNTIKPLKDTPIILQKMKDDAVTPDGPQITILHRTDADGPLVEAPAFARSPDGTYFLFFSSGCTRAPSYDLKYAWAKNITGPYTRATYPLLKTGDWGLLAPGSVGIAEKDDGQYEMAFHARVATSYGRVRAMFTAPIDFNGTNIRLVSGSG
ncbi:hypothetical protein M8818_000077 [Zalaria obscura]|uniref:Uncharacterized protein n=1 Tax=Zalaria obscura TaxID=2024903 RepID=A0ACC3SQ36_9PEZI